MAQRSKPKRRGFEPKIMTERSGKAAANISPLSFFRSGGIIFEQRESTRRDRPKARRRGSQTGDIIYNFILSFSQYFCLTLKTHLPLIREMSFQSFYISEGGNFVILLYLKFLLSVVVEK